MIHHFISDEEILKTTVNKLKILLKEDREAAIIKEKRDKEIIKLKLVFEAYSGGKPLSEYVGNEDVNDDVLVVDKKENDKEDITISSSKEKFNYPKNETWANKIIAVYKYANRVMKITEVCEIVKDYEPDYKPQNLKNVITNTINTNLAKNGILKVYHPDFKTRGFYYGSPLWWDENGELKKEHMLIKEEKKVWE